MIGIRITSLLYLFAGLACLFVLVETNVAIAGHSDAQVKIEVLKTGAGEAVARHSKVKVHYTGWLTDGTKFDSSIDRGTPFEFTLGTGQVIPGWDIGVEGMKVGGKRELTVPPELGYGNQGAGDVIPPKATLRFEVELISFTPPQYSNIDNTELNELLARGVKIIDVRRKDEWAETGIIKGSKLLTAFDDRGQFVRSFPASFQDFAGPDEEVILICRTGNRSSVLANMLTEQAGYSKVYNVKRGIVDWLKAGKPVVK